MGSHQESATRSSGSCSLRAKDGLEICAALDEPEDGCPADHAAAWRPQLGSPAGMTQTFDATSNSFSRSSARSRKACQAPSFLQTVSRCRFCIDTKSAICLNFRVAPTTPSGWARLFVDGCALRTRFLRTGFILWGNMASVTQLGSNVGVGKRLLNAREAAQYLGLEVDTVYRKARLRELPSVKVGRALRFDLRGARALRRAAHDRNH